MRTFWTKYLVIPFAVLIFGQAFAADNCHINKVDLHDFIQKTSTIQLLTVAPDATISKKGPDGIPYSDPCVESETEQEIEKIISFKSFKLTKVVTTVPPTFYVQPIVDLNFPRIKKSESSFSGITIQTESTLYLIFQVFRI